MDAPRLMVETKCAHGKTEGHLVSLGWPDAIPCDDPGEQRPADERDIGLVVAWLREQGAVDYQAAERAMLRPACDKYFKGHTIIYILGLWRGLRGNMAQRAVDAALSPTGQEGEGK